MVRGLAIFGLLAVVMLVLFGNSGRAIGACTMSYCKGRLTASVAKRVYITNTHRQIVGDLYRPGHGQRIQIRNRHRQIIGYVEAGGLITNTNRQKIGATNE